MATSEYRRNGTGILDKKYEGDLAAIQAEIRSSTSRELVARYGIGTSTVSYWASKYKAKPKKKQKRMKCRGCGKRKPLSEFQTPNSRCHQCKSAQQRQCPICLSGFEVAAESQRLYCSKKCRNKVRAKGRTYLQQKRWESWRYPRSGKDQDLSWKEWVGVRCPALWFGVARLKIVYAMPRERKFPDIYYAMSRAAKWRWRYRNDPEFNLQQRIRAQAKKHRRFGCLNTRLRESVRYPMRNADVFALLGYSPQGLREHLERQFSAGMTWQRFTAGEIHIDHVRPLKLYDLDDPEQVRAAWALPNLQPLWAKDNLAKAAKTEKLL